MARAPRARADAGEAAPESDRLEGFPHPREAVDLVGHREAEAALLAGHAGGRLHHAWMLAGPKGIGKATLAYRFARFLLAHPDPAAAAVREAQNLAVPRTHSVFAQVAALSHPDLAVVRRPWNRDRNAFGAGIAVDDMRAGTHIFQGTAALGGWRIAIVDAADDLNEASGNALLKVLEEPPQRALFLVIAHNPSDVLVTIRSRCRLLRLAPLTGAEVERVTRVAAADVDGLDEAAHARAAALSQGSASRALGLLDPDAIATRAEVEAVLARLPRLDDRVVQGLAERLAGRAREQAFRIFCDAMEERLSASLRREAALGQARPARLAAHADLWDKLAEGIREIEIYNLDVRPFVLAMLTGMAAADIG
jgi:DNA polymerase-3 subunit delta'